MVRYISFESFLLTHPLVLLMKKRKEKKRKINNDLVIWPSHDNICISTSRNPIENSIEFFPFNYYWLGSELQS